jgi:diguanylate cyclase (GGDEF)-like protein
VVAVAEASRGWRWGLPMSVLSVLTVAGLVWAQAHGLTPPSMLNATSATYGAAVIACLVALAIVQALLGARMRWANDCVVRELSERRAAERRMRALVDNAPFGAFVCESHGSRLTVVHANLHASVTLGDDASMYVGEDVSAALPVVGRNDLFERLWRLAAGGESFDPEEIEVSLPVGERLLDLHAYQTEPGAIAVFFSDVTKQRLAESKIRQMAYHDSLTTLPNRLLLLDRLGIALATSRRRDTGVALLFIDLDNFKTLNDNHGHAFGDMVLVSVGRRLLETARASDTVARIGGDEFMVLMPDAISRDQAETVARKIVDALREPLVIDGRPVVVTASIGVTASAEHHVDAKELLALADHAMYEMKREGRDGYRVA